MSETKSFPDMSEEEENDSMADMRAIEAALEEANKFRLNLEVICWAIYHAKSNPEASVADCMQAGLMEWDV